MKLVNQCKLKWCLVHYSKGETTSKWAAKYLGVSQRRFQQIYKQYQTTGKIPNIGLRVGRPKKEISQEHRNIVKQQYGKTHYNTVYLQKKINHQHHIHISYNVIHRVLLELGYADHEVSKQKRRKTWIRYERTHSLSPVHTDYHYCQDGRYLCTILDDASRKVLAAGEFDSKTTENALTVLKQAYKECEPLYYILF